MGIVALAAVVGEATAVVDAESAIAVAAVGKGVVVAGFDDAARRLGVEAVETGHRMVLVVGATFVVVVAADTQESVAVVQIEVAAALADSDIDFVVGVAEEVEHRQQLGAEQVCSQLLLL